jgi:nucleoside-diphosphate-sugar epimerase
VIYYISKKLEVKIKPKFNSFGKEENPTSLVPDIKKVKKFNWSPKKNFYEGLDEYIKWFKND